MLVQPRHPPPSPQQQNISCNQELAEHSVEHRTGSPLWVEEGQLPMAGGFEELGLASELVRAVKDDLGYLLPTDVQDEAIPLILGGGDVMVAAETGSGKTAAFSLPLLQIVHEDLRLREGADSVREKSAGGPSGERLRGGWRISEVEKDLNVAVSADGLACQSRELKWVGARGQNGIRGGVYCYEV